MANATHTPGPFFSRGRFTSDTKETCANMHAVYDSRNNIIACFDNKPDANLFASAPDLLAALKDLLGTLPSVQDGECSHCGREYGAGAEWQECPSEDCPSYLARKAIAKATGNNHLTLRSIQTMPTIRTETITLYQFDELEDKAKEVARNWFREVSSYDEWWKSTYEDARQIGLGITEFDNRASYVKAKFLASAEETANKIVKEHGEDCGTYKAAKEYLAKRDTLIVETPLDDDGEIEDEYTLDQALDELDAEFLKTMQEEYLSILRKEYEFQQSDETIDDNIRANEYTFLQNGKRKLI